MDVAVDIETRGLDATKFIIGCVYQGPGVYKYFDDKKKMYEYIVSLGKPGKVVNVYAHNHQYDAYGYMNFKDKNLKVYSIDPFIASYVKEGKEVVKFLDTWAIYRMSLKAVGGLVDLPKKEMPLSLLDGDRVDLDEVKPYLLRDVEVVYKAVKYMRNKLRDDGINIKRVMTINQIANNYVMMILKSKPRPYLFYQDQDKDGNVYQRRIIRPGKPELVHQAYRGGRNEAFKLGSFENCFYYDCNSLYPYAITKMRFPNVNKERYYKSPLDTFTKSGWFSKIGYSKVILYNKSCKLGAVPIRVDKQNYYPGPGKYIVGTYTHVELEYVLRNGYKLIECIEGCVYDDAPENPLKKVMLDLYKKRNQGVPFDRFFYKQIMNSAIGKFAQTRSNQEFFVDSVENANSYLEDGCTVVRGMGTDYLYQKTIEQPIKKDYYFPLFSALVNAYSRIYMHKIMKQVRPDHLVYTDTDSIITVGNYNKLIPVGENIGQFKIEHEKANMLVYGNKTYRIGSEYKVSGVHKSDVNKENFEEGLIETKRMKTLKTAQSLSEVGTFYQESRDLVEQSKKYLVYLDGLSERKIYIDKNLYEDLNEIGKLCLKHKLDVK